MDPWHTDVVDVHAFFEAYFRGELPDGDVGRLDAVLAPEFTIVSPRGVVSSRSETLDAVRGMHGRLPQLRIRIEDAELLADDSAAGLLLGRYVEVHDAPAGGTRRLSTVVMSPSPDGPNGLVWHTVHETWLS